MRRFLIPALLGLLVQTIAPQVAVADSRLSVVRVSCIHDKGEMKATGFIWPKKGQMVTALHAVAGCKEVEVYSQKAKKSTKAKGLLNVDLEADLALLQLEDDLGLEPVPHVEAEPADLASTFMTWGYPLVHKRVIGHRVEFGLGFEEHVTTIGQAFAGDEVRELFKKQAYPGKHTKILRITSTIQPGHSGAPIFDERGHVVAIADGGLLGGFKGVNWSIPAHIYLVSLPHSDDPHPTETSDWAGLFSATVPSSSNISTSSGIFSGSDYAALDALSDTGSSGQQEVAAYNPDPDDGVEEEYNDEVYYEPEYLGSPEFLLGDGEGPFLLRQVTLREALDYVAFMGPGDPLLFEIESLLWDDTAKDEIWFNVYMDDLTGATLALPYDTYFQWIPETHYLWGYNPDNTVVVTLTPRTLADFPTAVEHVSAHAGWVNNFAYWDGDQPANFMFQFYDEGVQHAAHAGYYYGTDVNSGMVGRMLVNLEVNGVGFVGGTVFQQPALIGEPNPNEMLDTALMELAARYLSRAVPDYTWAWAFDEAAAMAEIDEANVYNDLEGERPLHDLGPEPDLSLVRQLSLRQALEYMDYVNSEDPLINNIETTLWDEALKDEIWFSVYEDSLTGATVAVPSWMAMEWNNDTGHMHAYNADETLEMNVSVIPGEGFEGALEQLGYHVDALNAAADWVGYAPEQFEWQDFDPEAQYAAHAGYYTGFDYIHSINRDMLMSLAIYDDIFLGATVYMDQLDEEHSEETILEVMMMEVSARYLSTFATF